MRMHKSARRRRKAGFTLVELLVTIVLIGIISIATFAVFISSLNTFGKQKDAISALELKDLIVETVSAEISKSIKLVTVDSFTEGPLIKVIVKDEEALNGEREEMRDEIETFFHEDKPYLRDNKVRDYSFIYSYNGRIYMVESNMDGRVNYDTNTHMPTSYPTPPSGIMYGNAIPLLDDHMYDKYMVDLAFKPLFTEQVEVTLEDTSKQLQNRYYALQVIVTVSTKATAEKPSEEVARGVETIMLDNVRHGKRGILYRNENTVEWQPTDTVRAGTFKYCYYAQMKTKRK